MKLHDRSAHVEVGLGQILLKLFDFPGVSDLLNEAALVTDCKRCGCRLARNGTGNVGIQALKFPDKPVVSEPFQRSVDLGCASKACPFQNGVGSQRGLSPLQHLEHLALIRSQIIHSVHRFPSNRNRRARSTNVRSGIAQGLPSARSAIPNKVRGQPQYSHPADPLHPWF